MITMLKSNGERRRKSSIQQQQQRRRRPFVVSRRLVERNAIIVALFVFWAWIMVGLGMLINHGYLANRNLLNHNPRAQQQQQQQQQQEQLPGRDNLLNHNPQTPQQPQRGKEHALFAQNDIHPAESPMLIFTCQRANYLRTTLETILEYIPDDCSIGCPLIISQDGKNEQVAAEIKSFQRKFQQQKGIPVVHLEHASALRGGVNAYQALAVHYGWALRKVFNGEAKASYDVLPGRVLILEEDIRIAPDFFSYMAAMAPVLESDKSLFAVSAFNDNGFEHAVKDTSRVLRSDFFPGLGWMMSRKLWDQELNAKWPNGYWDDWLREPVQRLERHVLRPEVSRTYHFGSKGGASSNQFGDRLTKVHLNNVNTVDWTKQDLSYLQEDRFDRAYWELLQASVKVTTVEEAREKVKEGNVRLEYFSFMEFQSFAESFGLMQDEKAGVPRTAYRGIVETRPEGKHLLLLTPPLSKLHQMAGRDS